MVLLGTACFSSTEYNQPMTQEAVPVTLARMEEKIDQCLNGISRQELRVNNHANRIQTLEIWKSRTVGYVSGIFAAVVAAGAVFGWIFGR